MLKPNKSIKYRWTDAWLLGSIALACKNKPAELWEIFHQGDLLNHTLFTLEEIESGLVRLTVGGWVSEQDENKKFFLTDKFKKMKFKIRNIDSVLKLERILEAKPWDENEAIPHPDNNLKYPGMSQEILIKELKLYKKNSRFPKIQRQGS